MNQYERLSRSMTLLWAYLLHFEWRQMGHLLRERIGVLQADIDSFGN